MLHRLRPLTREEVRSLDVQAAGELGLPTLLLMENAGRGAAAYLAELAAGFPAGVAARPFSASSSSSSESAAGAVLGASLPRVLVVCGPGNNGGDGGVVARHLDAWSFPVRVVWLTRSDQLRGDARTQWDILARAGVDQAAWYDEHADDPSDAELDAMMRDADWLVDGLLGTGLARPVAGAMGRLIEAVNRSGKPVFALDLPSGLDCDTGRPLGTAVRARATATFAASKLGFHAPGAAEYTGEVAVIDIGLPRRLLEPYLGPPRA